ncbi:MAG TPA: SIMPL domain-containing protein [Gracilimonas sp.]|nr:SIMPL domain-containing protein [Gracilimonas sp.]
MDIQSNRGLTIIGAAIFLGLVAFGFIIGNAAITFKEYERTVTVKGLAEEEHLADIVIWPIQFTEASNQLEDIYEQLESSGEKVRKFLTDRGINENEISISTPLVTDKSAQRWGGQQDAQFRFVADQTVTIYSEDVKKIREVMSQLADLGKQGITLSGDEYQVRPEYLFNSLNDIKPQMIEAATKEARAVAEKFAEDSNSQLGKIKTAYQGQFSISPRDNNNPHIKNVRVVSTVVYYLSD